MASIKGIAACSFGCGRSVFFRGLVKALAIASRTIRRCTFTFLATPAIVPTPNSYSRRISSNSSTLALQSNGLPLPGNARIRVSVRCQAGPIQTAEMGQFRLPKSFGGTRRELASDIMVRLVGLLAPGGLLGIVLPQSVLDSRAGREGRQTVLKG